MENAQNIINIMESRKNQLKSQNIKKYGNIINTEIVSSVALITRKAWHAH